MSELIKNKKTDYIVKGALIAAAYTALTYLSNIFGLAYGPIQFRVSEVLTLLPIFSSAAIPGLTVGCFLANISSFNLLDMVFGTLATLIAALFTRMLRNKKIKDIPLASFFPPVIINSLVIGLEINFFFLEKASVWGFIISALQVGLGEFAVCFILGIPLFLLVRKNKVFNRFMK